MAWRGQKTGIAMSKKRMLAYCFRRPCFESIMKMILLTGNLKRGVCKIWKEDRTLKIVIFHFFFLLKKLFLLQSWFSDAKKIFHRVPINFRKIRKTLLHWMFCKAETWYTEQCRRNLKEGVLSFAAINVCLKSILSIFIRLKIWHFSLWEIKWTWTANFT